MNPSKQQYYEVVIEAETKLLLSKEEAEHLRKAKAGELSLTLSWKQLSDKTRTVTCPKVRIHAYGDW